MKELELYIHIPFCERKCAYCDFLSFPSDHIEREHYVKQLIREINSYSQTFLEYEVRSLFIGGGTPSLLKAEEVLAIMIKCREIFVIRDDAEITIECNPGSVTQEKAQMWAQAGINRVSIGLQSTSNDELQMLGRIHTYEEFLTTYHLLRSLGFNNINVDLISGIPGQTLASYEANVIKVCNLDPKPEHISAYSLIIEEGTVFGERYLDIEECKETQKHDLLRPMNHNDLKYISLPDEETDQLMYERTAEILAQYGYHRYEISNYSLDGYECIHNKGYWERVEYLGLGLGASSQIGNYRFSQTEHVSSYLNQNNVAQVLHDIKKEDNKQTEDNIQTGACSPIGLTKLQQKVETLSTEEEIEECVMLGLRLMDGISDSSCIARYGVSLIERYYKPLFKLQKEGLITLEQDTIRLTAKGIRVSNYVIAEILY